MLKDLTLKKRMIIGFTLPVILVLFSAFFNRYLVGDMDNQLRTYVERDLPQLQNLQALATNSYSFRMPVLVLIRTQEAEERDRLRKEVGIKKRLAFDTFDRFEASIQTEEGRRYFNELESIWTEWNQIVDNIYAVSEEGDYPRAHRMQLDQCEPTFARFEKAIQKTTNYYIDLQNQANSNVFSTTDTLGFSLNLISAIIVGLIIAVSIGVYYGISRPIRELLGRIRLNADQTNSASQQVAVGSQSLASGASQQAASVEETSASLEEIASMIENNRTHTAEANQLGGQNTEIVKQAYARMQDLLQSMEDISENSAKTQNIIKTIDEIAFQTNLLALNAAVEAARAGEAGAGFAVVAEEVRNLAMRSAEAAKETAQMIETSVNSIHSGKQQAQDAHQAFHEVQGISDRVGSLIGEIAAGSVEQAQGIHQLNLAVQEIDKVVQTNAASAEESAAAAEELSAQSSELNGVLDEFSNFMGLSDDHHSEPSHSMPQASHATQTQQHKPSYKTATPVKAKAAEQAKKVSIAPKNGNMQAFYDSFDDDFSNEKVGSDSFRDF